MSKEEIKIKVPIITNEEISQFERLMKTEFETIFDKVSKHIYRDKECIYLQEMIKKLKNDLEKEKEKNKKLKKDKKILYGVIDELKNENHIPHID